MPYRSFCPIRPNKSELDVTLMNTFMGRNQKKTVGDVPIDGFRCRRLKRHRITYTFGLCMRLSILVNPEKASFPRFFCYILVFPSTHAWP